MSNSSNLANLRDIHLPKAIGWWPPAIGWWLLFILVFGLVLTACWFLYRYLHAARAKRQALKLLTAYQQEYQTTGAASTSAAKVSELLRRVALAYFPRKKVAYLHDEAWIEFLNKTSKNLNFYAVKELLLQLPYQRTKQSANLKPLFTRARAWIKQRGKPCLN